MSLVLASSLSTSPGPLSPMWLLSSPSEVWDSNFTGAINAPLDFRNGPGVGLQTHTAVFAAVAIVTAGVSTTEVEIHTIRATCAAFAIVAIATTGGTSP